jgi:endoglucanase
MSARKWSLPLRMALLLACTCGPIGSTVAEPSGSGAVGSGAPSGSTAVSGGASGMAGATAGTQGGAGSDPGSGPEAGAPVASAPGGYHVVGPKILDAAGSPHMFHGVDRPSLEWSATGESLSASDYEKMKAWKANVVRIALNQDFWLANTSSYRTTVAQQVTWAEAADLDVILDLHWSDKGQLGAQAGQQCMADQNSMTFWTQLAGAFKGDGRVLFELYNEPHDVPVNVWLGGGPACGFQVAGMQQLYGAVRATGAENLVLIGGLKYAFDLSFVSGYAVQGHNIVYVTHPYHSQYMDKEAAAWYGAFGYLAAQVPVMATEFGDQTGNTDGCATSYYTSLLAYFNGTPTSGAQLPANPIHWTGWAWYPADCSFPSLIKDWQGTPTPPGQVEQAALLAY